MGLWGAGATVDHKPKWLTEAEKKDVYANTSGWVGPSVGRAATRAPEILVAIRSLSTRNSATDPSGTGLALANITSIDWTLRTAGATTISDSGFDVENNPLSVTVTFNERISINVAPGMPGINVAVSNPGAGPYEDQVLQIPTGTAYDTRDTNRITFEGGAGSMEGGWEVGSVLTIKGANAIDLESSVWTETDGGTAVPAAHQHSLALAQAAGSITVVA